MYGYYYFDYTYFLFVIPALLLSLYAQIRVQSSFNKYSKVKSSRNITAADAAKKVLSQNGITDIRIEHISGNLTDHFDPRDKVIRLSDSVYNSTSVAAVGVACHEAGHAVQNAVGYVPIKFRQILVPITQFSSKLSIPLILIGLLLPTSWDFMVYIGIALFGIAVLFELVTLPVEFNASSRAIKALEESYILYDDELDGARKVLKAAALTYLASMVSAVLTLLRFIVIAGNRRGND